MIEVIYADESIAVCVKPARVLSTDEEGGMPELVRQALGTQDVRTVHRLDRVVGGVMVLARSSGAASALSAQIRDGSFEKEYRAVIHGTPQEEQGRLTDLLLRDKARKMTLVVPQAGKGVQEAALRYRVLHSNRALTRLAICLETGRTHQIRVQFASRGLPLVGERKYSEREDDCQIALWSYRLCFSPPEKRRKNGVYKRTATGLPVDGSLKNGGKTMHYDYFQNKECEYFPCHEGADPETFSCLFCYCPLYALGEKCGGSYTYTPDGIKDCSKCLKPHRRENYNTICLQMCDVLELVRKKKK